MFSSAFHPHAYQVYNIDDELPSESHYAPACDDDPFQHAYHLGREKQDPGFPFYSHQALTAHNKRMILPYTHCRARSAGSGVMRDQPLALYKFFEFHCVTCEQSWLSPLYRAKDGLYCRICHTFCQPRGIRHSFTPYLGKETCYGKYLCHNCNRGFSSYKSLSNCPDQCFQCGTLVYPYYQIAHSVLYQKIRKNDTNFKCDDAMNRYRHESPTNSQPNPPASQHHRQNRHYVRKIASGIITSSSSAKQSSNKKRLHCLNNVQLNNLASAQLGRRAPLKPCYSEPTIGNTNAF